jgi:hypothetical protein
MESQARSVERLLEALSPTIAVEIERIIGETTQALQADFERRLEQTVLTVGASTEKAAEARLEQAVQDARDAVRQQVTDELQEQFKGNLASALSSTQRSAESQLEQAVHDARETARQQVIEELRAQFERNLEETTSELRARLEEDFRKASAEWARERIELHEQLNEWRAFAEAQSQLADAPSQGEILTRFLRLTEPFAASAAVYVAKPDGLAFWKSRGPTTFPAITSQQTADPESFFRMIVVRAKPVAAVAATRPFRADALQFLCGSMERAIEMFGIKLHAPVQRPPASSPSSSVRAAVAHVQVGPPDENS